LSNLNESEKRESPEEAYPAWEKAASEKHKK